MSKITCERCGDEINGHEDDTSTTCRWCNTCTSVVLQDGEYTEWCERMERNAFTEPVKFSMEAETDIPNDKSWGREFRNCHLKATVNVSATGAVDVTDWICNIDPESIVDVGGVEMSAIEACELLECGINKLGDLFLDAVAGEVYQRIVSHTDGSKAVE